MNTIKKNFVYRSGLVASVDANGKILYLDSTYDENHYYDDFIKNDSEKNDIFSSYDDKFNDESLIEQDDC